MHKASLFRRVRALLTRLPIRKLDRSSRQLVIWPRSSWSTAVLPGNLPSCPQKIGFQSALFSLCPPKVRPRTWRPEWNPSPIGSRGLRFRVPFPLVPEQVGQTYRSLWSLRVGTNLQHARGWSETTCAEFRQWSPLKCWDRKLRDLVDLSLQRFLVAKLFAFLRGETVAQANRE